MRWKALGNILKTFLIGLITVFCYQGALSIFPMIVLTYKLLLEKNTLKENIKEIVKISALYITLMIISVLYTIILFGNSRIQVGAEPISLANILFWINQLVTNSLGVIPPFMHIGFIILISITIFLIDKDKVKDKIIFELKYLFIIIYGITICLAPTVVGSGLELGARMCISYSCTIGLSLFIMFYLANLNNNKYQKYYIAILTVVIFLLNFTLYIVITNQHLLVNKLDKENCLKVEKVIEEYEAKNNVKVTKISAIIDTRTSKYYPNTIQAGPITIKALNFWAAREVITFYTNRNLEFKKFSIEELKQYFSQYIDGDISSNEFSLDQVVIKGDTLYFYGK